jgi:hypothetical protein
VSKFSASIDGTDPRPITPTSSPTTNLVEVKPSFISSTLPQISITVDKLPSLGKAYPPGTIIQYRPYTFGEIKKISQSKLDPKSSFEFVLLGIETSFDVKLLTIGDFFYLGILRRISTLGSDKMSLPYRCRGCSKTSTHTTDIMNIDFEEISAPELPIIVEFENREIEFNPITVKDLFDLLSMDKHSDEIALLAKQCSNIPFEEAYSFINNANPNDSQLINEVDRLLYHSTKEMKFKCKEKNIDGVECGFENSVELDGGQALIIPFREREESTRSKIHFGKPHAH